MGFLKRHNSQEQREQERRQNQQYFESWKANGEVVNLLSRSEEAEPYNNTEKMKGMKILIYSFKKISKN